MIEHRSHLYGLMAEFDAPDQLIQAAERATAEGYRHVNAYTPFPVEGLAEAIGFHRSSVPLLTLIGGVLGGAGGFGMQYWISAVSYPLNIGGRPFNSWPAFIPVTFEMTVLGAALFAVLGMLALNKLPMPHHPVFNVPSFARASKDRFFLCIEARDQKFDRVRTAQFLESLKALGVSEVEDV
ncbi:MAG: DUF3341 domain-containing protein [Dongiaceae bacterium]